MSAAPSESTAQEFVITLEQTQDFEFTVRFDSPQFPEWRLDEPAPLGRDAGPNAARVLAAAIGNCLSASLLFCARKAKVPLGPIRTRVRTRIDHNARGRLRISRMDVEIDPVVAEEERSKALRCLDLFEDYCLVTESVRHGIDVQVSVLGFESAKKNDTGPDQSG
jgi:organic hydroperoxide reductase OsmC/OhrA